MLVDRRSVGVQWLVSHSKCGDVFDPVCEPLLDGPGAAGFAHIPRVSLLFQFLDCPADFGFGFAFDVAPIGLPVVTDADGDPTVPPVVVLAVVDGGCAVRCAGSLLASAWH